MDNDLSGGGKGTEDGSPALVGLHTWFEPSGQHTMRVEAVEATGAMIGIEERQRWDGRVEARPANPAPLTGVMGASALLGTGLEMCQPRPEPDLSDAYDRIASARGLVTGLVVSTMMWAAIAVSAWQALH